jgi:hypothetical protein
LEGGPPRFGPRFTGADLLRNVIARSCSFVYGTIALYGARFHALQLPHDFVTRAGRDTCRTHVLQPLVRNACPLTRTKFGLIPFRSPLLGESRLIYFPRGTEMFQFPRLPLHAYVFSVQYRRITSGGFPHSEIRGSQSVQRLPAAYRSRPRPSSTPGAKASTMCPYYLDGDHAPSDPRVSSARGDTRLLAWLCSFQGPQKRRAPDWGSVSQNSTA